MRIRALLVVIATAACVHVGSAGSAEAGEPAVDGMVIMGVDQDLTGIGRGLFGGMYGFGKFAVDAHIGFDGFLRIDSKKGLQARSLNLINLGVRYGITSERFIGPFVAAGGGFGLFTGKPHQRKIQNDPDVCASATATGDTQGDCFYRVDKNVSGRLGVGYGFRSGPKTTVAVRLDVTYFLLSLNDFEDQCSVPTTCGAPVPNMVDRPQDTWAVMIGLEFMRWR